MPGLIQKILQNFYHSKLIVIGDLILDHYALGAVKRISPEAPIQILDIAKEEYRLGGSSNVAHNLAILGAKVNVVGVVGEDNNAHILKNILTNLHINHEGILGDATRPTTVKTRLISQGHHLLRVDKEARHSIDSALTNQALSYVNKYIADYDGIVISDYAKGFVGSEMCRQLIKIVKHYNKKIFVGPKGTSWDHYCGADMLSANRSEIEAVTGIDLQNNDNVAQAARKLLDELDLGALVITLGAQGMYINSKEEGEFHIRAEAREVFDVAGAGDTVLALLSLGVLSGYKWKTAARLATTAAGIVVGKVGTATVSPSELANKFSRGRISLRDKIKVLEELLLMLEWERSHGRIIVFTNGCFDLLHPGHLRYLEYCKSRGDVLIVGLNSDDSIQNIKGHNRPIMSEKDRAEILASLSFVDYIVVFSEQTPCCLIEKIRPDVLIKGSDWANKGVVGREVVESYGGVVELYNLEDGYSTSNIIEKIRKIRD